MVDFYFNWNEYYAGWAGGVTGLLLGHPYETIKVHYQNGNKPHLSIMKDLFRKEGVFGFYKGIFLPLLTAGVINSIFFGTYANALSYLERKKSKDTEPKLGNVVMAAMFAGIPCSLLSCPTEVIKIQLQITPMESTTGLRIIHLLKVIKTSGMRRLYRGVNVNLIRDVPSWGIYMLTYNEILKLAPKKNDLMIIMAGGTAGIISWVSIIPLDVIKSRMQGDSITSPKYKNAWHCMLKSFRENGIRVFYRGTLMIVLRSFPVNAVTFLVYEYTAKYLGCK